MLVLKHLTKKMILYLNVLGFCMKHGIPCQHNGTVTVTVQNWHVISKAQTLLYEALWLLHVDLIM